MNIIFVCTGNTCRSPMAEYYLKSKKLPNLCVTSRGFSGGEAANPNSVSVMREAGIDISGHTSTAITADDIAQTDAIICMTDAHRQILSSLNADNKKIFVLGDGIADPFGCDITTYRNCRDDIFLNLDKLIDQGFFGKVTVRIAVPDDIFDISNIEKQCFSVPWSENAIRESMAAGTIFYVAKTCGKTIGYMGLSKISGEGYVTNVAVLPEFRRQGIGKDILKFAIDDSIDELEFMSLEVRVSNEAAISLYENFGFKNVGTRKRFYTNPAEDAFIMTKNFI